MPLNRRVWRRRSVPAVFVGAFADPAGMRACVFADPGSGRAIGPMNLQLGARTGWTAPAPRVGAPPDARPGALGLLDHYRIEWEGHKKGPDAEARGVFLRFEPGPESRDLGTLAVDGFLLGLLGDDRRLQALREPVEVARAQWGLIVGRHAATAAAHLARVKKACDKESRRRLEALTALVFQATRPKKLPLERHELVAPGVIQPAPHPQIEGFVEPDPGPFADGTEELPRFLRAGGVAAWREGLRGLEEAAEVDGLLALGVDAAGRLAVVPRAGGAIERLHLCCPDSASLRFGDAVRLIRQRDRVGWIEPAGANAAAEALDVLREERSAAARGWVARAAEEGATSWERWKGPSDARGIREALGAHPSAEHARRLEKSLPGEGAGHEKLGAVLTAAAAYWRAGAFEDAWILLGRMPSILPETADAPVLRAARRLHRGLEHGHFPDADEEAANELSSVWDGTLAAVIDDLGPALAARCAQLFEDAGL
jgi:hypothetical protein